MTTAPAETAAAAVPGTEPLTVVLLLELRGRRESATKRFAIQIAAPATTTLKDLTPYVLEKSYQTDFGMFVKRTYCTHAQYDAHTRTLQVQHSVPRSKGWGFIHELGARPRL